MVRVRVVAVAVVGAFLAAGCGAGRTAQPSPPAPERMTATLPAPAPGRTASAGATPAEDARSTGAAGDAVVAPEWRAVPGAELEGAAALVDVAVAGPRDVWAVGYQASAEDREGSPAVVRWDGDRWREVPLGGGHGLFRVEAVSAGGPDDVWIAGNGEGAVAGRWNGGAWSWERPFGVAQDYRLADVAVAGDRVWLAANGPAGAVVVEWDGRGFRTAHRADGTVRAITARAGRVWAVGHDDGGPAAWLGSGEPAARVWEETAMPAIPGGRLGRVWQVSPSEAWAVGEAAPGPVNVYGRREGEPLVLRWDGSRWTRSPVPVARGALHGVTAFDGGDVWASGTDAAHPGQALLLRFDGTRWSAGYGPRLRAREQEPRYDVSADVGRTGIARVPGTGTLWAVGSVGWGDDEDVFVLRRASR
ncbi:hypothetical protein Ppa06_05860 [Planomonospora parontospora subsp. parontospora]|uniref:LigA protein n=2 Tax=Planomonospora parontospora TaxID=58119 RepID=A0AA37BD24_9ACTN|nr:hypothetical protein [Planomonospora parontospora]GGK53052.1 hypothetical protein GCM10010126_10750 [Planomonospora parontospora]GII06788.1 hypothetical protein Ppa06_05860 [Planomonospora parontospora subsp. parontospora]